MFNLYIIITGYYSIKSRHLNPIVDSLSFEDYISPKKRISKSIFYTLSLLNWLKFLRP
jgi:hypothetical protein